jgi:hypothetical protein
LNKREKMKNKLVYNFSIVFIIFLFVGISCANASSFNKERTSESFVQEYDDDKNSDVKIDRDKKVDFGFYRGIIVGKIGNLQGDGSRVTFYVSSVTIYPSGQQLKNVDAWVNKPYFGIIIPNFILMIGNIYSGW